jgi:hypothetical protein
MTISRAGCRAIAVGALVCLTGVAVSGQDPTDGFEAQLRSKVANAGYQYDAPGLARALKDHDTTVAVTAAGFLSRFPPTAESRAALRVAAEERYEPLVVAATRTLQQLKVSGWESRAIARLPEMQEPVSQIQLAGTLALAGRSDGWPAVKAALLAGASVIGVAVENAVHFLGLTDLEGRAIDVAADLQQARDTAAPAVRQIIEMKLRQINVPPRLQPLSVPSR